MSELRATMLVALAAAGWGTWTLFTRGSNVAPIWQSVFILLVIALCALPQALRGFRPGRSAKLWALLALLGLFDAGNYHFFFAAIERGPVGVAVLAHYLAPVLVAALAPLLLRESVGPRTLLSLIASLGGLALLIFDSNAGDGSRSALPAALLGGASALFYAGNTLASKKLLGAFSTAELLSYHCLVSALLLAALAPALAGPPPPMIHFFGKLLAGALLLGVGSGALFYLGLSRIPAPRAAVLTYFEPLVASLVGILFWGERTGLWGAVGAALIVGGGVLVMTAPVESERAL